MSDHEIKIRAQARDQERHDKLILEERKQEKAYHVFCTRKAVKRLADKLGEKVTRDFLTTFADAINREIMRLRRMKAMRDEFLRTTKSLGRRVADSDGVDGWSAELNGTKVLKHSITKTFASGPPRDFSVHLPLSHKLLDHGPPRSTTGNE